MNFNEYLEKLNEGLIKSYDINFTIDKVKQYLSILNTKFDIQSNPNNSIKLTIYNFNKIYIDEIFNLLNSKFTNLLGWFPSYMYLTTLSGMNNQMNYDEKFLKVSFEYLEKVSIIYECKFDEVEQLPDKLYHLSIQEYENKIRLIGICPKSKNKISSHGNRIYVCSNPSDCSDLIPKMKFYFFRKKNIKTKWIIYEIITDGLDINLYKDPNYPNKGYYILGNIPPNKINVYKKEI
jgi:hypothetical protein